HDRGDARLFQSAGGETDALVADGAVGNKDGRINPVGLAASDHLGTIDLERDAMATVGGKTMKMRGNSANPAACRRVPQLGQRKPGPGVFGGRMFAIDTDMGNAQVMILGRLPRVDLVELGS